MFVFCRSSIRRREAITKIRRYEADGLSASLIAKSRRSYELSRTLTVPSDRTSPATSPEAEIKDPFVLEFLGFKDEYSEAEE
jgi:predicted nuclease of restriction endonuclease-like (RecB) superfamily